MKQKHFFIILGFIAFILLIVQPIDYGIHYITTGPPGKKLSIELPRYYHEGVTWNPKHLQFVEKLVGERWGILSKYYTGIWIFKMLKAGKTSLTATKGWFKKRKFIINIEKLNI